MESSILAQDGALLHHMKTLLHVHGGASRFQMYYIVFELH